MQWYYSKNGTQLGPVEQGELLARIATGEVTASDLVWRDGMADWVASGLVQELRAGVAGARPPLTLTDGTEVSPYAPPTAMGPAALYAPPVPSNGKATASMVLGIISTVFGLCTCYGAVIAIPCGILAIVFGTQVKQAASLDPVLAGELGKVKAGIITGWIGLGLSVLTTVGILLAFGLAGLGHTK
ncbi:MAG: DUF4339 domain-containing protein [Verrucomicrobiota bacterium]